MKCLGINTPIIMFDGTRYKNSKGQFLEMFKVITRTGDSYIVNSN
jgi:hypothetical protein